mmetsp:Transcript_8290/g.21757  ORF Transcript_8290/g.21757 Transcript_8290/m.21757 type:complete len:147 (+) Transcript_8290:291-731(+)
MRFTFLDAEGCPPNLARTVYVDIKTHLPLHPSVPPPQRHGVLWAAHLPPGVTHTMMPCHAVCCASAGRQRRACTLGITLMKIPLKSVHGATACPSWGRPLHGRDMAAPPIHSLYGAWPAHHGDWPAHHRAWPALTTAACTAIGGAG